MLLTAHLHNADGLRVAVVRDEHSLVFRRGQAQVDRLSCRRAFIQQRRVRNLHASQVSHLSEGKTNMHTNMH